MNVSEVQLKEQLYTRKVREAVIRIGIVLLLAFWSFQIFKPFLGPVVWGIIISIASYGAFSWLKDRLGGSDRIAAALFALLALAILITPAVILSDSLLSTAQGLERQLEAGALRIPEPPERVEKLPIVGQRLYDTWLLASTNLEDAMADFQPQIKTFSRWLLTKAVGTGLDILLFALSIIIAAIFLANAEPAGRVGREIFARVADERGEQFVNLTRDTVLSVARGVLGIAVLQTLFLAVGLIVAGVPGAGLLSVITLLFAIAQVPMLLLFLPIIGFVFATADTGVAIPFAIWSVFFSFADGFLKPLLLGRGLAVPMPVILIGVIGGMIANGIIGLFVGPIVLSFSYVLFMVWLAERAPPPGEISSA